MKTVSPSIKVRGWCCKVSMSLLEKNIGCDITDEFNLTFCDGRLQDFVTYFFADEDEEEEENRGKERCLFFPLYDHNTGILYTDLVVTMKSDRRGVTLKKRLSYLRGGCYWPSQQACTSVFLRREEMLILLHRTPAIALALFASSNRHIAYTLDMINVFGQATILNSLIQRNNHEVDWVLMLLNNETCMRQTFLHHFVQYIFQTWSGAEEQFTTLINTTNLKQQLAKLCRFDVETFQVTKK